MYGGHVVAPGGLIFDFNMPNILAWCSEHGINTILADDVRSPLALTIKQLSIDFPMYVGPVRSLDTDLQGNPTLLLHLFPPADAPYLAAFVDPGDVYPIRLQTSGLEELEL
ncbi:hypothetical protein EV421DRAFT_1917039 [Armillaria borealis]|uniref:Uncharacterized protein n=1 Tax=Armillaria borealis TaxID=47425 RepID=A0AA39IE26_9AGAR|nr:hypothetical protein EV421DRAFT_1917039 [Armillaria borealis]